MPLTANKSLQVTFDPPSTFACEKAGSPHTHLRSGFILKNDLNGRFWPIAAVPQMIPYFIYGVSKRYFAC